MKKLMMLMALTSLTACDDFTSREQTDRADGAYKAAMSDYRSGRLDAAVKGFEKVMTRDPANGSARFQYACLMQDSKRDYLAAFCAFYEYLRQHPDSDKAAIARDRLFRCEAELAKILAEKHGLIGDIALKQKLEEALKQQNDSSVRTAQAEKDVADLRRRVEALSTERDRLVKIVRGEDLQEQADRPRSFKTELKSLLEEEGEETDRIRMSDDVAQLKLEEKTEMESGPLLLPARTQADIDRRKAEDAAKAAEDARKAKEREPSHPPSYVVTEGDTLFRIAERFYGTITAWKRIRDANKAVITTDGRIRAGTKIILP